MPATPLSDAGLEAYRHILTRFNHREISDEVFYKGMLDLGFTVLEIEDHVGDRDAEEE